MDPSDNFVPKMNIPRTFGRQTIYVYPEIMPGMSPSEKSYGFMVTKSALETADLSHDQMLQILAGITRTGPLVNILTAKFLEFAETSICEAGDFEVLSYHGRNGKMMNNSTLADGSLKPTDLQATADRRPAGIMYAKIACFLQFNSIDPENTSAHPFSYFIILPNETRLVQSSAGNPVSLTTFFGANDWHLSTDQSVIDAVWDHPKSYRKPFTLLHAKGNDLFVLTVVLQN
jgi:hypothetical protein